MEDAKPTAPGPVPRQSAKLEAFEVIAERKGTAAWLLNATAAHQRWAKGREVTEAQFDAAIAMVAGVSLNPM